MQILEHKVLALVLGDKVLATKLPERLLSPADANLRATESYGLAWHLPDTPGAVSSTQLSSPRR